MFASIIIPTKNAGPEFSKVLETVLHQEAPWDYEVLVIDSGSSDGTWEFLEQKEKGSGRLTTLQIPPEAFRHGATRNLGVEKTRGEFVVFLTQDALPVDETWLRKLVDTCAADETIAGVFGKHLAYPTASKLVQRDLELHFQRFTQGPNPVRLDDPERYQQDEEYRKFLHFFSNNNSCIRRSVWEKFPFPSVNFAEDQAWAKSIIEAGYSKAYADSAVVFHSHDYSPLETLKRSYDESRSFYEIFGYRLIKSQGAFLGHLRHRVATDFRYLERDEPGPALHRLGKAVSRNLAMLTGYYLGSRVKKGGASSWFLSLDQSVKRLSLETPGAKRIQKLLQKRREHGGVLPYLRGRRTHQLITHWSYGKAQHEKFERDVSNQDVIASFQIKLPGNYNAIHEARRRQYQDDLTLAWVIPYFVKGGGGHFNIFRCQKYLEELFGIKSTNFFYPSPQSSTSSETLTRELRAMAKRYYGSDYSQTPFELDWEKLANFPIVMATGWNTAYPVLTLDKALLKSYFIQDYEADFYPPGAKRLLAERTYDFGYFPICAGNWLPKKIGYIDGKKREQAHAWYALGADPSHYYPEPALAASRRGVCFYLRSFTERRGFELSLAAIQLLQEKHPEIPISTIGMPESELSFLKNCHHYGVRQIHELRGIYSRHHVYVTPSFTNYSLLPAEIIACGGRVIDLDLECNRTVRALFPAEYHFLAKASPIDIVDKIQSIVKAPPPKSAPKLPDWKSQYEKVGQALLQAFGREPKSS